MTPDDQSYGLIVAFEDQSPSYVHGYELGKLSAFMEGLAPPEQIDGHETTVHAVNRVTLDRMCAAFGWSASWRVDPAFPDWAFVTLTKTEKPTAKPNPYGLRLVSKNGVSP